MVGGFDVILADKGFRIKGQISAMPTSKLRISADIGILGTGRPRWVCWSVGLGASGEGYFAKFAL